MPLQPGHKLGPYEILSPIGAGGMGEVYKARDQRLDRVVAIKVSAVEYSERFEREARAVAALNHPNICQLYDVGPNYLVMEYVDGAPIAAPGSTRKRLGQEQQLVKVRSGSSAPPIVLKKWSGGDPLSKTPVDWSSNGEWILTSGQSGLFLLSPDGGTERQIYARTQDRPAAAFSRDGRQVWLIHQNTSGTGAPWQLLSIDVATGAERHVADVGLPVTAGSVAGFSLHPDGTRFLTSYANWPFDIWMVEGFDE